MQSGTLYGGLGAVLVANWLTKEQKARLETFPPEEQAKIKHYLKREWELKRAKELNPIGFYKPIKSHIPFFQSTARQRVCIGGNRSGKTQDGAAEAIHWLSGHSPYRPIPKGPLTGVISGESFDVLRNSVVEKLLELCPKNGSFKLTWTRDDHRMEGPNGVAIFKSAEQGWQAYQAIALDWFWMDEEQSYEIFKQLSKRLKRDSPIQSWHTFTAEPDKPDHWTFEHLYTPALDKTRDVALFEFDLEDNRKSRGGFIDDSDIDNLIDMTPVDDRPAVIHGKYVRRGGLVYPMWSRQHHVTASVPLKMWLDRVKKGELTAFCALDWGVRNPTAIGLFLEDRDENVHLVDEIYHPAESTRQIQEEYKQRFAAFQPAFVVADPSIWNNHDTTDPSHTIAGKLMTSDYERGLPALPLLEADNDITNGLAAVRELLSIHPTKGPKLKVQDRCVNFIREIENYTGEEYVNAPYSKNKKETPRKKGDHAMDMTRYFAMSPHAFIGHNIVEQPSYDYSEIGIMRFAVGA